MASVFRTLRNQNVGLTPVVVGAYTAGTHSSGTLITGLTVANILGGPTIVVTVAIKNGATTTNWVVNAVVMQGGNITLADENTRHALANGDQIMVSSNILNSCDVIGTVLEIDA